MKRFFANQLVIVAIIVLAVVTSCLNNRQADAIKKAKEIELENFRQDSIKKAKEIELEEFRQDSIDASQIKGYSVKLISGKHKYGKTEVQYQSLSQLFAEQKAKAEKEMWSEEKLQSVIKELKTTSVGGWIRLDISRRTIGAANTEYFTIIVKDTEENEIFRKTLDSDIPNAPLSSSGNWWNIVFCSINVKIKAPFYIYIIDALLGEEPFKFEVTVLK